MFSCSALRRILASNPLIDVIEQILSSPHQAVTWARENYRELAGACIHPATSAQYNKQAFAEMGADVMEHTGATLCTLTGSFEIKMKKPLRQDYELIAYVRLELNN